MVAFLQAHHARPHIHNDTGAFVPKNRRENSLWVCSRTSKFVGMANSGRPDFYQNLARPRPIKLDSFDTQRRPGLVCNSGFDFHPLLPVNESLTLGGVATKKA